MFTLDRELTTERLPELRVDMLGLEFRLVVIERLGEELRVEILGALLRLDVLGATDWLGLRVTTERDCDLEAAAGRLLLLLELPLFRELLAAKTGSTESAKMKTEKVKMKKVIPAFRDSTILNFDL